MVAEDLARDVVVSHRALREGFVKQLCVTSELLGVDAVRPGDKIIAGDIKLSVGAAGEVGLLKFRKFVWIYHFQVTIRRRWAL